MTSRETLSSGTLRVVESMRQEELILTLLQVLPAETAKRRFRLAMLEPLAHATAVPREVEPITELDDRGTPARDGRYTLVRASRGTAFNETSGLNITHEPRVDERGPLTCPRFCELACKVLLLQQ